MTDRACTPPPEPTTPPILSLNTMPKDCLGRICHYYHTYDAYLDAESAECRAQDRADARELTASTAWRYHIEGFHDIADALTLLYHTTQ